MAGSSLMTDAQNNRMIRASNRAQHTRFAHVQSASYEAFKDKAGQRSNQLMQISEATGQKRVELESQARQAAASVSAQRDSVVGASVDAELQAVHAARGRADQAAKRNLMMQELNYYQGTAFDSSEAVARIMGQWKPDQPTISGAQMLMNAGIQGLQGYAMAGGFNAPPTAGGDAAAAAGAAG